MDSGAIIAIIGAVALAAVQIITAINNGRKVDTVGRVLVDKTEEVAGRLAENARHVADEASHKLEEIHVQTNSNLAVLRAEVAALKQEVANLQARNRELEGEGGDEPS